MWTTGQVKLARIAEAASARSSDPTRHKVFISYHHADQAEAEAFVDSFGEVFIPRVLGISDEDDFIDSTDTDYIMDQIREKYLTDSTVTLVLVGKCTWARRYIDWEIYSSLRHDKNNRLSGLVGFTLPSAADYSGKQAPPRLADNLSDEGASYAKWWKYPSSAEVVRAKVEEAFQARTSLADLRNNDRERMKYNRSC